MIEKFVIPGEGKVEKSSVVKVWFDVDSSGNLDLITNNGEEGEEYYILTLMKGGHLLRHDLTSDNGESPFNLTEDGEIKVSGVDEDD